MASVILFVFGAVAGSFLNVAALRYRSGLSLGGRSSCGRCGHSLKWFELVPILSFVFLRGRCLSCKTKISWQYPLVEAWAGALFVTVSLITLPVFCLYVIITVYDLRHKVIPDPLSYAAAAMAGLLAFASHSFGTLDWLAGPLMAAFLGAIWLFSRGRALGLGDAKLALSIGLLLGAAQGFSALIIAFWAGAAWGIGLLLMRRRNITIKSELPFAPFLVLGTWAAAMLHPDLLHVTTLL